MTFVLGTNFSMSLSPCTELIEASNPANVRFWLKNKE